MADVGSTPTPGSMGQHGATDPTILQFAFHMKKEGYRDSTIERAVKVFRGSKDQWRRRCMSRGLGHCLMPQTVEPGHKASIMADGVEKSSTENVILVDGQQIRVACDTV